MSNDSEADEADQQPDEDAEAVVDEQTADEEAPAAEDAEQEDDAEEGLQNGDFVELAYTARTVDEGTLVDTTDQEVAEEAGVAEEGQEFAPRTLVLGQGHLFQPVEDDIIGKEVGDTGTVTVPAAEAFGEYDESEVRTVSANKIPEDERYPGAHVDVDGQHGHLETIIGGRARVDFNHPLAGEDIEYDYEVLDVVDDREAQAQGLLGMFLDLDLDVWFETETVEEEQLANPEEVEELDEDEEPEMETVEVQEETLFIEATPELSMNQQWLIQKDQIAQQLTQLLGVDRVVVQEELGGGMMGGLGGMMGGMGGGGGIEDIDIDADEIAEEIDDVDADEIADELEDADLEE